MAGIKKSAVPDSFESNMKVGDEMKLTGSLVRITKIELVVHVKNIDKVKPENWSGRIIVPMADFNIPFLDKK